MKQKWIHWKFEGWWFCMVYFYEIHSISQYHWMIDIYCNNSFCIYFNPLDLFPFSYFTELSFYWPIDLEAPKYRQILLALICAKISIIHIWPQKHVARIYLGNHSLGPLGNLSFINFLYVRYTTVKTICYRLKLYFFINVSVWNIYYYR